MVFQTTNYAANVHDANINFKIENDEFDTVNQFSDFCWKKNYLQTFD